MGRPYNQEIDRLIFDSLKPKVNPVPYNELFRAAKGSRLGKKRGKLSPDTFNSRLHELQSNDLLLKNNKNGYILTDKAYVLDRLKILDFGRSKEIFLKKPRAKSKQRKKVGQTRIHSNEQGQEEKKYEQRIKTYMMLSQFGSGYLSSHLEVGPFFGWTLGFRRLNNESQYREFLSKYQLRGSFHT